MLGKFETICRCLLRRQSATQEVILSSNVRRKITVTRDELYYDLYDITVLDDGNPVEDNLGVHSDDLLHTLGIYIYGDLTGAGLA